MWAMSHLAIRISGDLLANQMKSGSMADISHNHLEGKQRMIRAKTPIRIAAGLLAFVTASTLVGCGQKDNNKQGGGEDEKGATGPVRVTMVNHPWSDFAKSVAAEFTEETGISVEINTYDDDQLSQLYNVKLNAGSNEIDVIGLKPLQEVQQFTLNEWLTPLNERIDANPEWDWQDFQESAAASSIVNESIMSVPIVTETAVIYYRKDLLEEQQLDIPTTFDELWAAAELIQEDHPDMYPIVGRGQASGSITQFSSFLYGFGGYWYDDDGNATMDTPEALKAYEYYGGMLNKFGPPGAQDHSRTEAVGLFNQGLAAFYPEGTANYAFIFDDESSTVADKAGVMPMPAGPAGSHPYNITAFGLAISSSSQNQDAAWEFIRWITSKEMVTRFMQANVAGARMSVWNDEAATADWAEDLIESINAHADTAVGVDRPQLIAVAEAREVLGQPIVTGIQGGNVQESAETANSKFQELLDAEK
jgi:multiple sugar transport system substrate-binding protein